MPRGRTKLADRPQRWNITLPTSLVKELEPHFLDPLTGKPQLGARSELVAKLLRQWLRSREMDNSIVGLMSCPIGTMREIKGKTYVKVASSEWFDTEYAKVVEEVDIST